MNNLPEPAVAGNQTATDSAASAPRKRIEWLDVAKFVALLITIFFHFQHYDGWRWHTITEFCAVMTLPVFWVAGGYTTRTDFSLWHKFRSLMVPYAVMSVLCVLYQIWAAPDHLSLNTLIGVLYARFYIVGGQESYYGVFMLYNGVLWFLPSFFCGYALLKLIYLIKRLHWQALAAAVCVGVTFLFPYFPILLPWGADMAFFIAPLMWLGHLLRRFRLLERFNWMIFLACAVCYTLLVPLCTGMSYFTSELGANYPCGFFAAFLGTVAWLELFLLLKDTAAARYGSIVARRQMWIYGLQMIFIDLCFELVIPQYLWGTLLMLYQLLAVLVGGWAAGWLYDNLTAWSRAQKLKFWPFST